MHRLYDCKLQCARHLRFRMGNRLVTASVIVGGASFVIWKHRSSASTRRRVLTNIPELMDGAERQQYYAERSKSFNAKKSGRYLRPEVNFYCVPCN